VSSSGEFGEMSLPMLNELSLEQNLAINEYNFKRFLGAYIDEEVEMKSLPIQAESKFSFEREKLRGIGS